MKRRRFRPNHWPSGSNIRFKDKLSPKRIKKRCSKNLERIFTSNECVWDVIWRKNFFKPKKYRGRMLKLSHISNLIKCHQGRWPASG